MNEADASADAFASHLADAFARDCARHGASDVSAMKKLLMSPLPCKVHCCIMRAPSRSAYTLCLVSKDDGSLVELVKAGARRPCAGFNTVISLNASDFAVGQLKRSSGYLGKVRADSQGFCYSLFDDGLEKRKLEQATRKTWQAGFGARKRREHASIFHFESPSVRAEQRLMVAIPAAPEGWYPGPKRDSLSSHHRELVQYGAYSAEHESMICFNGWVTQGSLKNISLVASDLADTYCPFEADRERRDNAAQPLVRLSMRKMSKHRFDVTARPPLSLFQAFAVCLSRFSATKTLRERAKRAVRLKSVPKLPSHDAAHTK